MGRFNVEFHIYKHSGRHVAKSSDEDLKKVVKDLVDHKAMQHTPGKVYQHRHDMHSSFLWNFNIQDMQRRINNHKRRAC